MTVREQIDAAWKQMLVEYGDAIIAHVDLELAKLIFQAAYVAGATDQLTNDRQKFSEIIAGAAI